jgi:hypothetical protein
MVLERGARRAAPLETGQLGDASERVRRDPPEQSIGLSAARHVVLAARA